jgi:hypothetical protein
MRRAFGLGAALAVQTWPAAAQSQAVQRGTAPDAPLPMRRAEREPTDREGELLPDGLFLPVGVYVGSASHADSDTDLLLGLEASAVLFPVGHSNWNGVYVDVLQDFGNDSVRTSLGLEVGFGFLGLDGGALLEFSEHGTYLGYAVRPMLSFGVIHVYGRWGFLPSKPEDDSFREIGVLLKYPIQLAEMDEI